MPLYCTVLLLLYHVTVCFLMGFIAFWTCLVNMLAYVLLLQVKGQTSKGWGEYSDPIYVTTGTPYGKLIAILQHNFPQA